mgnify:CR=1 FL=1
MMTCQPKFAQLAYYVSIKFRLATKAHFQLLWKSLFFCSTPAAIESGDVLKLLATKCKYVGAFNAFASERWLHKMLELKTLL